MMIIIVKFPLITSVYMWFVIFAGLHDCVDSPMERSTAADGDGQF